MGSVGLGMPESSWTAPAHRDRSRSNLTDSWCRPDDAPCLSRWTQRHCPGLKSPGSPSLCRGSPRAPSAHLPHRCFLPAQRPAAAHRDPEQLRASLTATRPHPYPVGGCGTALQSVSAEHPHRGILAQGPKGRFYIVFLDRVLLAEASVLHHSATFRRLRGGSILPHWAGTSPGPIPYLSPAGTPVGAVVASRWEGHQEWWSGPSGPESMSKPEA